MPYLLDALWDHGERALARTILWQDTAPSWLYEVNLGATTIWENWDAMAPDGSVTASSFNHYAFGCVDDWLYRRLGGITPTAPGYRSSRIEPDFDAPLDWARAHHDTPYGRLAVEWRRDAGTPRRVTVVARVPVGTTAEPVGPDGSTTTLLAGTTRTLVNL